MRLNEACILQSHMASVVTPKFSQVQRVRSNRRTDAKASRVCLLARLGLPTTVFISLHSPILDQITSSHPDLTFQRFESQGAPGKSDKGEVNKTERPRRASQRPNSIPLELSL